MNIAITTPTGHIGSRLVQRLLDAGANLTLLLRHPEKLDAMTRNAVTIQQGELQDADFVRRATAGIDTLFWLTPNDPTVTDLPAWYAHLGNAAAQAVQANRISRVVNLSSAGAQLPQAGPITGLGQIEQCFNETPADVIHLRPGYFMENTLMQLDNIRYQDSLFGPGPGNIALPHIATRDIAAVAAPLLLDTRWTGKTIRGLHGPKDLSFDAVAMILSELTAKPIHYVQITPEQTRQAFLSIGFSLAFANSYLDMVTALSQPGAVAEPRTPETTTATTFAQWARESLLPVLNSLPVTASASRA